MVTLGGDPHKRTHTFMAVDELGQELKSGTFTTTSEGHLEALAWAKQWPERRWAIEDCRQVSRRLERDLLSAGERVVRVPARLSADSRRSGRKQGKSDPVDALAVARAALREPNLPVAQLDGPSRDVKLLLDHREDLVGERTRIQNRLRWHLHELEPGLEIAAGALDRKVTLRRVRTALESHSGLVAEIAGTQLVRLAELTQEIRGIEKRLASLTAQTAPTLLQLHGCGALSAAKIVAEVADVSRFHSSAAFALHNGSAPIPVWSGQHEKFRLNRGGNRQLNAALHRIAITQVRYKGLGFDYVQKRKSAGSTTREALRSLKRQLSNEVYRRLLADRLQAHDQEISRAA